MGLKDRLSGYFLIFFSAITMYLAFKVPMGRTSKPGPGLFPLLLSLIIGVLALFLILRSPSAKKGPEIAPEEKAVNRWAVFYLLGDLCLYGLLFRPLGFILSTFVFLIALKPVIGKKWIPVLLGSALISLCFFFFFNYLLKVELPMGLLAK